ncbi:penicillin acylase family protein [Belliella aquatica]|uniref:Beta-lactam antibiotic acylase n=1 Tax=Belliella aquatica TaxID=1323734 RepID=A0ABQ1M9U0_9BACT|nr:penicillin acylase family protein [Belliella aquatica]MCH7405672.1 penicillin acylase family protein [Belliella aquatica]GGC36880.1 beta-lactam antibiotic acylase [Belliella aquatica]
MKYIGFAFALIITLSLGVALSLQFGSIPPLGKLLDPNHGFWQNSFTEDQIAKEEIFFDGLIAEVTITYDEDLIPHIFAENEEDLYRAQGYVTAQHRLWQMEFQTMAAAGRVSEIVGPIALDLDRMTRRKGLPFAAEQGLQYLETSDTESLRFLNAYAEGVNLYINELSEARLPIEYKILNYRPENWSAYKSILLLKYMADMLVGDRDLEYTNLRNMLGEELLNKLFPLFPEENDPVIEAEKVWDFEPLQISRPDSINYPEEDIFVKTMPQPVPGIGSNNWAVSGTKTQSGKPILANDPHLGLNLPSLWYAMQLTTPEYSVKGATLPGALGIISGFNENIAWGVTNATRDTRDWYAIQFKQADRLEYLYNDQWIQSTFRIEEIKVKGQAPFMDTVVYTHHGPIVYDKNFRAERQDVNFALKWTAHLPSNEQKTFLLLNKGQNHNDYIEALNHYTSPAQNFVFASNEGDIAIKVQGKFPLKWEGQGKFLMDGNDPRMEWKDFIPNEHNAATLNPARGFVSSANQHSVDPSYPYYVFDNSFEHYRNRRLNERLRLMGNIRIEDMMELQFDNYHLHAAEALPVMLNLIQADTLIAQGNPNSDYLKSLMAWDFYTNPSQTEPSMFDLWWRYLNRSVWEEYIKSEKPVVLPNKYQTVKLLQNESQSPLFDKKSTDKLEIAKDHVLASFDSMIVAVEKFKAEKGELSWATFKNTTIQHLVPNFKSFSYEGIQTGGGANIINATSERHGASWRMVVELGDEPSAFGIYPGGQSGNPGSKFYDSFLKKWANGEYVNFKLRKATDQQQVLFKTTLKP